MNDFPAQAALQQRHARSVSGEELEAFGKKAADVWSSGKYERLTEAVVETIKQAGLSPEQVRRVVEFANTAAYLQEFNKEGSHRVIEFDGGPADPAAVLQDLNDGGGGTVFDRGTLDYTAPPREKRASSEEWEGTLKTAFAHEAVDTTPRARPLGDVLDLRDKLASLYENQTSLLSGLELMYQDVSANLYHQVKQAAMEGVELGEMIRAWAPFIEDPAFVKAAFVMLKPRLVQDGVFTEAAVGASSEKTGSARGVNPEHPLIVAMTEFCGTLQKLAETRQSRDEVKVAYDEATNFLRNGSTENIVSFFDNLISLTGAADQKTAAAVSPGAVKRVTDLFAHMSGPVEQGAGHVGDFLLGKGSPITAAGKKIVGGAVKYAPHAVAGGLAVRGAQHLNALADTPAGRALKSFVPGTPEFQQKNQELTMQYGGFPYPMY